MGLYDIFSCTLKEKSENKAHLFHSSGVWLCHALWSLWSCFCGDPEQHGIVVTVLCFCGDCDSHALLSLWACFVVIVISMTLCSLFYTMIVGEQHGDFSGHIIMFILIIIGLVVHCTVIMVILLVIMVMKIFLVMLVMVPLLNIIVIIGIMVLIFIALIMIPEVMIGHDGDVGAGSWHHQDVCGSGAPHHERAGAGPSLPGGEKTQKFGGSIPFCQDLGWFKLSMMHDKRKGKEKNSV